MKTRGALADGSTGMTGIGARPDAATRFDRDAGAPTVPDNSRATPKRGHQSLNIEHPAGTTADVLAVVRPLVQATRWGAVVIGMVLVASGHHVQPLGWGLVLAAYSLLRTFRPLRYHPGRMRELLTVLAEVALTAVVVMMTGYWSSPFFFSLAIAVVIAGFARSFFFAIITSMIVSVAVGFTFTVFTPAADLRLTTLGASELLLMAFVTGYARRIFGEAEARTTLALDRVSRLSEANDLLQELHRVTQGLPSTLDLDEVLASTTLKLREMLRPSVVAILLFDSATRTWAPALVEGARVAPSLTPADLPGPIAAAVTTSDAVLASDLSRSPGPGIAFASRCGIYVALWARSSLIGVMCVEHRDVEAYDDRAAALVQGLAEQVALAVDNARWFSRIRTVGADEERTRIARDLHDRVGQSLAYLGFELDRINRTVEHEATHEALATLRQDVRRVVGEVRDTLYDLRTDVSETQDLASTIESFLERVRDRSELRVVLRVAAPRRLPLPQERELWRIAQEAITNAERHAMASCISVSWQCDQIDAVLEIADDGRGFAEGAAGRLDSYGMLGMRERADSIGATLDIKSRVGRGTVVRCTLGAK